MLLPSHTAFLHRLHRNCHSCSDLQYPDFVIPSYGIHPWWLAEHLASNACDCHADMEPSVIGISKGGGVQTHDASMMHGLSDHGHQHQSSAADGALSSHGGGCSGQRHDKHRNPEQSAQYHEHHLGGDDTRHGEGDSSSSSSSSDSGGRAGTEWLAALSSRLAADGSAGVGECGLDRGRRKEVSLDVQEEVGS